MAFKQVSLFDFKSRVEEVKPAEEKKNVESLSLDYRKSIYRPNAKIGKYILYDYNTEEKFGCHYYDRDKDEFIGNSTLAMKSLNMYYDRSIIPKEVG